MAQLVVIVEILVAERDPTDPLADQSGKLVHHKFRRPVIDEAGRDTIKQSDRGSAMAQQQRTAIRADRPAIEHRDNAVSIKGFKLKLFRDTLCRHRPSL